MKKGILIFMLLIPIALADNEMYIQEQFYTPSDIYGDFQFNADNVYLNIDGVDYQNSIQQLHQDISDSGFSMSYVFGRFYELWYEFDSIQNTWVSQTYDDLEEENDKRARAVFESVFVPRTEVNKKIFELEFENQVFKSLFNESILCQQRQIIALQYGIKNIVCNNIDYQNILGTDTFVHIESLPEEPEPYEEVINVTYTPPKLKGMDRALYNVCKQNKNNKNWQKYDCENLFEKLNITN